MNPDLDQLQSYPFEKLRQLFASLTPASGQSPINFGMGEPQHRPPQFVLDELQQRLPELAHYPSTRGTLALRQAIAHWLERRFELPTLNPDRQVIPVAGTREALFAIAQAVVDRSRDPLVLSPNPFYQIYEGAALLAGARLQFLDCTAEQNFLPDLERVDSATWQACQLLYICNPGNPSGAVLPLSQLTRLVALAREHDFVIASDECYSEIYQDEAAPPPGLLQACHAAGETDYHNCIVFHSLSKRSNLPGLRSGFVAGDASILQRFLQYRTYQGCALPVPHQWASAAAWADEDHVRENRALYRAKFSAVHEILKDSLSYTLPTAGFYLWPQTPLSDTVFAQDLYRQHHITVLPGQYLGRDAGNGNPGQEHVRMALVPPLQDCIRGAELIHDYCQSRKPG